MSTKESPNMEALILETAERLFLDKGFAQTSTTEIAKEAGCNQALVHYYYRTKDRLIEAVFAKIVKLFANDLVVIGSSDLSFEDKLRHSIQAHFDMLKRNPQLPILLFNELATNPKRIESLQQNLKLLPTKAINEFTQNIREEIEEGKIRAIEPLELLLTIISLNAFVFIASPLFKGLTQISDEKFNNLLEKRREENVRIVLESIKP